jgi:hypothetical protein
LAKRESSWHWNLKLKSRARTFFENFVAPFPENNKRNQVDAGCVAVDCGAGLGARVHGRHPKAISAMGGTPGPALKSTQENEGS